MVVNNLNIGMQSNMLGVLYEINQLPVDFPTQALSQSLSSPEWETTNISSFLY